MPRCIIYPYKMGSKSAKALQEGLSSLGIRTLRVYPNRNYRPRPDDYIINWGMSTVPSWYVRMANEIYAVRRACDKRLSLDKFYTSSVPTVEWTESKETAKEWATSSNVYCRTVVNGRSGQGIVVASTPEEVVDAPLYTKGVDVAAEYRVHIWNGQLLDFQQKKKRNGVDASSTIRNHDNGWVFCRGGVSIPENVKEAAVKAVAALDLTFGAVDVITDAEGKDYALEVNTAPGLTGTTLNKYVERIANEISNRG